MTKGFILGEIIRMTEANAGTPIGRSKFLGETGIKDYDWGRFWATWGDAVREAGFTPNKFASPLDEDYLLAHLALLTRKHKHFPTKGEMRLEKINNPSFPGEKSVRRFGSKDEAIKALLDYCRVEMDFADVAEILEAVSPKLTHQQSDMSEPDCQDSGYVYLIRSRNAYKIGCTQAPYRRAAEIANQSAYGAELIHLIPTDDPFGIEKYWLDRFEARKVAAVNKASGEWFELSAADVRAFKRRKSFM